MATFSPTVESIREVDHVNLTSEYDVTFQAVVEGLNRYALPAVILVGIIGNSVSFMVYAASGLRHQSSSVYLAFLNLVDLVFLLCMSVVWLGWVRVYIIHRPGWCQLVVYLSYVSAFLSVWTVVLFTVERCIVVYFPLARLVHCTRKRALIVIGVLAVVGLGLYACSLWTTGVLKVKGRGNACLTLPEYEPMAKMLSNVDTFITLVAPSLLIIALNLLITKKIWYVVRMGATAPSNNSRTVEDRVAEDRRGQSDHHLRIFELSEDTPDRDRKPASERCARARREQRRSGGMESCCLYCGMCLGLAGRPGQHASFTAPSFPASHAGSLPRLRRQQYRAHARHTAIQLSTTRTLLVISSLFVLLNLPSHAFRVYVTIVYLINPATVFSRNLLLWQQVFIMLYYANFGANFFMYCGCSRKFRCVLGVLGRTLASRCTGSKNK